MNRDEALAWLVENVDEWPYDIDWYREIRGWDFWVLTSDELVLATSKGWDEYPDEEGSAAEIITQADWLAAKQGIDTTTSPRNN